MNTIATSAATQHTPAEAGDQDTLRLLSVFGTVTISRATHSTDCIFFVRAEFPRVACLVVVDDRFGSWLCRNALPEVSRRTSFGRVALRSLFSSLARPSSRP